MKGVAPRTRSTTRRQAEAIQREAVVIQLIAEGLTFNEVAARFGVTSQRIRQIWARGLKRLPAADLEQHRENHIQLTRTAIRELLVEARNPNNSPRTRVESWSTIRGYLEREARVLGIDRPTRKEITVITESDVDSAIQQLSAELELSQARLDRQQIAGP